MRTTSLKALSQQTLRKKLPSRNARASLHDLVCSRSWFSKRTKQLCNYCAAIRTLVNCSLCSRIMIIGRLVFGKKSIRAFEYRQICKFQTGKVVPLCLSYELLAFFAGLSIEWVTTDGRPHGPTGNLPNC